MTYSEEDFLKLSGIQHFLFCRRQWALIHIEQQWQENGATADGGLMHQKAHDPTSHTRRGDILTVRAMKIHSRKLGISGECDVVEFHANEKGIPLCHTPGLWQPFPVEYKRGSPKSNLCDEAQLCAQGICLEEMLCCDIEKGFLYYGKERRRKEVAFTRELRSTVEKTVQEMHRLCEKEHTPKVKASKSCHACSLKELCLPQITRKDSVTDYLKGALEE